MKRVLVITYYWPPSGGSGVQRWVKFAKYLPALGWQPVIYTPSNPELQSVDKSLEGEIPPEVEVIRRPIREIYSLYRIITGKKAGADQVTPLSSNKKSLSQKLQMWVRARFFIPDPRVAWVRPSVKFLTAYLKEHPVDVMVSNGPPHSMHLIARELARRTDTKWVADFRDPWTKMFYFKHLGLPASARRKHEALELSVLNEADAVVAVSPLVGEEFRQMTTTPVSLITNGYDPEDYAGAAAHETTGGHFLLTHTGVFAADGNPSTLWKLLADKCRSDEDFGKALQIRLAGKNDIQVTDELKAAGLGDKVADLGYVTHGEAVKQQLDADLLLLPLRKEPECKATLPGKLFEYLASGRAILGLGDPEGAMSAIISECSAGKVADWDDAEGQMEMVEKAWAAYKEKKKLKGAEAVEKYSRPVTAARMAALLEEVAGKDIEP